MWRMLILLVVALNVTVLPAQEREAHRWPDREPRYGWCWVTHSEPGHYEKVYGDLVCEDWYWTGDRWRQHCIQYTYRRWVPGRTWKRREPCPPPAHTWEEADDVVVNTGVVDPWNHPVEHRSRGRVPCCR